MGSTLNLRNLAALGRNHSGTVTGQLSGVAYSGTAQTAKGWAKLAGAVRSSRIGTWFRLNPLKGAIIGGAAIDAAFEAAYYTKSRHDLNVLAETIDALGYGMLLIDISQLPDYESVKQVLGARTMSKRSAAFTRVTFQDAFVEDSMGCYLGMLAEGDANFVFDTEEQAKIDALCIMALALNVQDLGQATTCDPDEFSVALGNAFSANGSESLDEFVSTLSVDYSEIRTPVGPERSRVLDFQSFIRFRLLQAMVGNDSPNAAAFSQVSATGGASAAVSTVGPNSDAVYNPGAPNDIMSILSDVEEARLYYEQ